MVRQPVILILMGKSNRSSLLHRKFDYAIGIPIIRALGWIKKKPPTPDVKIKRIGFIQPTAIGDLLMCSGVISDIFNHFLPAQMFLFVGKSNYSAIELLDINASVKVCNFRNPLTAIKLIRSCQLDLLIDFAPWPRLTALICAYSGARFTVGFEAEGQHRHYIYDVAVPHRLDRHELLNLEEISRYFGITPSNNFPLHDFSARYQNEISLSRNNNVVVFHTQPGGSRSKEKSLPKKTWQNLGRMFLDQGYEIILSGGPKDEQKCGEIFTAITKGYSGQREMVSNMANRISLSDFCVMALGAKLVITVDTAIAHVAAMIGANVLCLYGPTISARWGAIGPRAKHLDSPHPARGFINFGFENHPNGLEVMDAYEAEKIFREAMK